jgi:hypothetical protein
MKETTIIDNPEEQKLDDPEEIVEVEEEISSSVQEVCEMTPKMMVQGCRYTPGNCIPTKCLHMPTWYTCDWNRADESCMDQKNRFQTFDKALEASTLTKYKERVQEYHKSDNIAPGLNFNSARKFNSLSCCIRTTIPGSSKKKLFKTKSSTSRQVPPVKKDNPPVKKVDKKETKKEKGPERPG